MAYKYRKACFGGTFDIPIHRGHEVLINKAFAVSEFCLIGLTTDTYASSLDKLNFNMIKPYSKRKKSLTRYLESKGYSGRYEISELNNFCDRRLMEEETDIEAIVVSTERRWVAEEINKERLGNGYRPFDVIEVKMVLAEDNAKISSSRIRRGEINKNGKILKHYAVSNL